MTVLRSLARHDYKLLQVALLIILLQDQWKKAKEANAKKAKEAKEPTKNPKEAHD